VVRTPIAVGSAAVAVWLCLLAGGCRPQAAANPAQQVRVGWERYRMGEFNQAVEAFESVLAATASKPTDPLHIQALYGLATAWNLRRPGEDPARAAELYRKVVELAPASDEAAWSMLGLARMKHLVPVGQEPDYPAVRKAYQGVIDRFGDHLAAQEAFLYQQSTLVATLNGNDARQALSALGEYIRAHPKSQFLSPLYGLVAECHEILKQPRQRLDASIKALETREIDPTNPNMDNTGTYWSLATLAEFDVGDFPTARKYYKLLIDEYPTDIRVHACEQALQRMDEMEAKVRTQLAGQPTTRGGGGS